jgi:hypothetical protein
LDRLVILVNMVLPPQNDVTSTICGFEEENRDNLRYRKNVPVEHTDSSCRLQPLTPGYYLSSSPQI